jgi:hypothetical protein
MTGEQAWNGLYPTAATADVMIPVEHNNNNNNNNNNNIQMTGTPDA